MAQGESTLMCRFVYKTLDGKFAVYIMRTSSRLRLMGSGGKKLFKR
jgi:hypothetical protein